MINGSEVWVDVVQVSDVTLSVLVVCHLIISHAGLSKLTLKLNKNYYIMNRRIILPVKLFELPLIT